jgi:glutathione S-transferase
MGSVPLKTILTDIRAHTYGDNQDYYKVNPKGSVPALVLDDGTLLNENTGSLNWIADQVRWQRDD